MLSRLRTAGVQGSHEPCGTSTANPSAPPSLGALHMLCITGSGDIAYSRKNKSQPSPPEPTTSRQNVQSAESIISLGTPSFISPITPSIYHFYSIPTPKMGKTHSTAPRKPTPIQVNPSPTPSNIRIDTTSPDSTERPYTIMLACNGTLSMLQSRVDTAHIYQALSMWRCFQVRRPGGRARWR